MLTTSFSKHNKPLKTNALSIEVWCKAAYLNCSYVPQVQPDHPPPRGRVSRVFEKLCRKVITEMHNC